MNKLNSSEITKLIIATNNVLYIKQCIIDREKLGLGSSCVIQLIMATKDLDYMKKCVVERENLRLAPFHVVKLIIGINDINYLKECVINRKELGLCSDYVARIIIATKDINYIKDCINNKLEFDSYVITKLILSSQDNEFIINCISNARKMGLNSSDISYLIKNINNINYTKECIYNSKLLGLTSSDISYLIISTCDLRYIKKCISLRYELGLSIDDIYKIILATGNKKFIKECIDNKKLGFSKEQIQYLVMSTNDVKYILDKMKRGIKYSKKIKLPINMTIGVELESVGLYSDKIRNFTIENDKWLVKGDETVQGNIIGEVDLEVTSPILSSSNKNISKSIYLASKFLTSLGQHSNKSCGGHIHIGANYLKSSKSIIIFLELWCNLEFILYIICNCDNTIPRGVAYASPISKSFCNCKLSSKKSFRFIVDEICKIQGTKGKAINFLNMRKGGINTIEFRCPNGTMNPDIWIDNINLFGGLIVLAENLTKIQNKSIIKRTDKEKKILDCFEYIKYGKLDNNDKLEYFLNMMLFNDEEKSLYMTRYKNNLEQLKKHTHLFDLINERISVENIIIE